MTGFLVGILERRIEALASDYPSKSVYKFEPWDAARQHASIDSPQEEAAEAARRKLVEVLREVRALLALPNNDFAGSSWRDSAEALATMGKYIAAIESGLLPSHHDLDLLFAPTGPIQEVSLNSGWGEEFLVVADQFEQVAEQVYS